MEKGEHKTHTLIHQNTQLRLRSSGSDAVVTECDLTSPKHTITGCWWDCGSSEEAVCSAEVKAKLCFSRGNSDHTYMTLSVI